MTRITTTTEWISKLNRERRRSARFFGPATAAGAVALPSARQWLIEENEVLLQVNFTNNTKSVASSNNVDDHIGVNVELYDGRLYPSQTSSDAGLTEGSQLVFAKYEIDQNFGLVGASGAAGVGIVFSHVEKWSDWQFLLEEDDALTLSIAGTRVVTGDTDWLDVRIDIITAVAAPRRL